MTAAMIPAMVFADESENAAEETTAVETTEAKEEEKKPAEKKPEAKAEEPEKKEEPEEKPAETKAEDKKAEEPAESKKADKVKGKTPSESDKVKSKKEFFKGKWGKLDWEYNEDNKTLSITGKGGMKTQQFEDSYDWTLYGFTDDIEHVYVGKGVTSIAYQAFTECPNIISVSLPEGLKTIDDEAFWGLKKLKSISFPSSLTKIGDWAFYECVNLKSITISGSSTCIGYQAFYECTGLKSVVFSYGVKKIDQEAFEFCSNLTEVSFGSTVTEIGDGAFGGCDKISKIYMSAKLKSTIDLDSVFDTDIIVPNVIILEFNPLEIKGKTATVKYSKVKKSNQTLPVTSVISFLTPGVGDKSYVKTSGNKKITINNTSGTVTVKKGLKKGSYKIKVKVLAKGDKTTAASAWKTTTFTVKVK